LGFAVNELLDLLELMDTENTPDIAAVRACLLSEASGDTSVVLGKVSRLHPFFHVHSRDGLLGGGGEVVAVFAILLDNFVKVLFEVV
jgi:hypothetical protein